MYIIDTDVLRTFGSVRPSGFAVGASTVESFIPDLDPHRNNTDPRPVGLYFEHAVASQGASR